MLYSIYKVLAAGMKYWFLCLAVLIVLLLYFGLQKRICGNGGQCWEKSVNTLATWKLWGDYRKRREPALALLRDNTIGSGRSADIVIRDASVQRAHALLYMQGGELILSPLAKGITQINGRRANQAYAVHTGDIISFGRVETRVFIRPELEQAT